MQHGLAAMQKQDLAEARRDFSRVVKLAPQIEPGHAALGSVLLALGDLEHSVAELQIAHRLDSTDLAADLNLGRAQVGLAHYDAAVVAFRACLSSPQPPELSADEIVAYATALSATSQQPAAITLLQQSLTRPAASLDSALLNDALGALLAQTGRLEDSIAHLKAATALDPTSASARFHLAAALLTLNRPEEALPYAQFAAAALPSDFNANLQLGRTLSALHRDPEALAALHRTVALMSPATPPDALYALALALQASGDARASLSIFASALAAPTLSSRGDTLTNYALACVQTGDAKRALALYAQALAIGPDTATLREDFGAAYLQTSDLDHALEQFKAGLLIDSGSAHLHYDLGLAFKLKDDLAAAIPEFERAAALDPALPDPAYTLGVIYMQQGRYTEAVANLQRATSLEPSNGDAWALLGSVLKDSGDPAAAAEALQHAIALQPDQPSLHIQLAALDTQAGRTADGAAERKIAADLSRAALSHQRAEFALKSGRTLLEQNKLPEAVVQLNNAAAAAPSLPEPHRLLADAYTRQGKAAEAALERKQAAALSSPPPTEKP